MDSIFDTAEWKEREKRLYTLPDSDIEDCGAVEYKYFSRFRDLCAEYARTNSKDDFQRRLRVIRKDYEREAANEACARAVYGKYQDNIKLCGERLTRLTKGDYSSLAEAFTLAVGCISDMRGEMVTEKAILRNAAAYMGGDTGAGICQKVL